MYSLKNKYLNVAILDPVADRERMGTRYCTGGYIFQITDHSVGDLLSGPTYPDSFNTFDGQGIPDAFNLAPLRRLDSPDAIALILGIGECDLQNNIVQTPCTWQVGESEGVLRFATRHAFHDWAVEVERTLTLTGRSVRSETRVVNTGRRFLPLCWFPHPFFPHWPAEESDELIKLNIPVNFPESNGYELRANGFIARKNWPWGGGHYQPLDHSATTHLVVIEKHPKLGLITATCSYVPSFFPIWGNSNTFSWEPFFERTVAPNQTIGWHIEYRFLNAAARFIAITLWAYAPRGYFSTARVKQR